MKKKILMTWSALLVALVLAACGGTASQDAAASSTSTEGASDTGEAEGTDAETAESADSDAEETETAIEGVSEEETEDLPLVADGYTLSDCIVLTDYKNLDLDMEVEEVTEEDVDNYLAYLVEPVEVEEENATLQEGDIADLDFVGKKDGEAFSGGSAEGYELEIGSGTFIPGFEDGMIGMKKGETRDLELTFPEEYQNEELAGQPVVFTVTLNAIKQMPEITDAWAKETSNGEFETAEAYRASIRKELEEQNQTYAETMAMSDAWEQILNDSTFKALPESYVQESIEEFDAYLQEEAEMYGYEDLASYLDEMGMTTESYEAYRDATARSEAKEKLALEALREAEGMTAEDEDFQKAMEELTELYEMSEAELRETYGDATVEEYVNTDALLHRVLAYNNL